MLDFAVAGESPKAFHLSNNLWAGFVAGFVYLLAVMLLRRRLPAFAAAMLFIAHPAHVEAVAWISSRKDLVAAAFALPAMMAYFMSRRKGRHWKFWYGGSIVLYTLAVAGKLSVAVVPAILLIFDFFMERRRGWGCFLDKVPFALIVIFFALNTMGAQPPTGHGPGLFTVGYSLMQNTVLLSGFGEYVLYRLRPDPAAFGVFRFAFALLPFLALGAPFLVRRRLPAPVASLVYWILLSLIPPMVLSFVHPVADRYLFFPSAGLAILIAWIALAAVRDRGTKFRIVAAGLLVVLFSLWTYKTTAYLNEWRDPRSVWYGAAKKSGDAVIFYSLGSHYQDTADAMPANLKADSGWRKKARRLAESVWSGDRRLGPLLDAWDREDFKTAHTSEFRSYLRELAEQQYKKAVRVKGTRVMPNLYFRRGKLALNRKELDRAETEFHAALEEAERHTYQIVRRELTVRCHYALGLVAWNRADYEEALRWLRMAEKEQKRFGGLWVPEIKQHRERLEKIIRQTRKGTAQK
jgi:tetratricopeptide (TPR) repeat protein